MLYMAAMTARTDNAVIRAFAERLKAEADSSPSRQVERAFLLAFARKPDTSELQLSQQAIADQGLWQFCRAMFNANEFIYID